MSQDTGEAGNASAPSHDAMLQWWNQQWLEGATPLARMQLAWMESLVEAMRFEAQCLHALAESGERLAGCHTGNAVKHPLELHQCYQRLVEDVTQTHLQRLGKVAELSEDFRKRIWEEL